VREVVQTHPGLEAVAPLENLAEHLLRVFDALRETFDVDHHPVYGAFLGLAHRDEQDFVFLAGVSLSQVLLHFVVLLGAHEIHAEDLDVFEVLEFEVLLEDDDSLEALEVCGVVHECELVLVRDLERAEVLVDHDCFEVFEGEVGVDDDGDHVGEVAGELEHELLVLAVAPEADDVELHVVDQDV